MNSAEDKLLTISVFGRNDNYSGDFKYRIQTCLNFIGYSLHKIGRLDDVEVVITDWNSAEPLRGALQLTVEAAAVCRFAEVVPQIAAKYLANGQVFHSTIAPNVGIRRGRGIYRMLIPADVLIAPWAMQSLLSLLDGSLATPLDIDKSICMCGRAFLPMRVCDQQLSVEEWERFIILNGGQLDKEFIHPFLGGCHAGQLMHRDLWFECQGNDESLGKWGWSDSDLTLRLTQRYPNIDLSSLGVIFYEISHLTVSYKQTRTSGNAHIVNPSFSINDQNWGLANEDVQIEPGAAAVGTAQTDRLAGQSQVEQQGAVSLLSVAKEMLAIGGISRLNKTTIMTGALLHDIGQTVSLRSFLEIGATDVFYAGYIGKAFPGCEVYIIPEMRAFSAKIDAFEAFAWQSMKKNYLRVVAGNIVDGIDRLRTSWVGQPRVDLAMIHAAAFSPQDFVVQIQKTANMLSDSGKVLCICRDEAECRLVLAKIPENLKRAKREGLANYILIEKEKSVG